VGEEYGHLVSEHLDLVVHRRMDELTPPMHCTGGVVSTAEAETQDLQLQMAFFYERSCAMGEL
jgi:hypothetical protein